MKTEDFERLKKLCDENGFELVTESPTDNDKFFVVKKKDIWEGLEFCKVAKIHKVYRIDTDKIYFANNRTETWAFKEKCTPSTEQAYVEQLKKEAFERFGEIKEGDRFIEADGGTWAVRSRFKECGNEEWDYFKESDSLFHYALLIYKQGKWAERVKKRISIRWEECDANYIKFSYSGNKNLIPRIKELAEVLEKYLNNEI